MRFEWDEQKNRANWRKHKVSFDSAVRVFDDPFSVVAFDRHASGEDRYLILGRAESATVLIVAHVYRESDDDLIVRIISARKATPLERRMYEEADK